MVRLSLLYIPPVLLVVVVVLVVIFEMLLYCSVITLLVCSVECRHYHT